MSNQKSCRKMLKLSHSAINMSFNSILYLCAFIALITHQVNAIARAQLDLPPLNTPTPHPEIYYNGYTPSSTTPAQQQGDLDRNARYGPPYYNEGGGDDNVDDYRVGRQCFFFQLCA